MRTTSNEKMAALCLGDSGAPLLVPATDEIVAVNSFGKNARCKGSDYSYRVDTTYAQSWFSGFLLR